MVCAFAIFLILVACFTIEAINGSNDFPIGLFLPGVLIGVALFISLAYVMVNQLLFFKQKFLMKKKYGELSMKEKVAFISVIIMVAMIVICLFTTIGQWIVIFIYKSVNKCVGHSTDFP